MDGTHFDASHILSAPRVRLDVVNKRPREQGRVRVQHGLLRAEDDDSRRGELDLDVRVENLSVHWPIGLDGDENFSERLVTLAALTDEDSA